MGFFNIVRFPLGLICSHFLEKVDLSPCRLALVCVWAWRTPCSRPVSGLLEALIQIVLFKQMALYAFSFQPWAVPSAVSAYRDLLPPIPKLQFATFSLVSVL